MRARITRRRLVAAGLFAIAGLAAVTQPVAAQWKPTQPIRIVVPWAAGGSTDRLIRVIARDLEAALQQSIVIVNQTGASGSIGTKTAMDACDGYTWTSGAVQDLGSYSTLGLLNTSYKDWGLFFAVRNAPLLSVNNNTPYKTAGELLDAMRKNPGKISFGTSGIPSAAHTAMEAIARVAGVTYRHVSYDGDTPTMTALVSGEIEATAQPAPGQSEMVRAKRVRPLAVVADRSLDMEGIGEIPPLTATLPNFKAPGVVLLVGVFVPPCAPKEVSQTLETIWKDKIANSEALKKYATQNGSIFAPASGAEAQRLSDAAVREVVWLHHDAGRSKVSPDTLGIPRP